MIKIIILALLVGLCSCMSSRRMKVKCLDGRSVIIKPLEIKEGGIISNYSDIYHAIIRSRTREACRPKKDIMHYGVN